MTFLSNFFNDDHIVLNTMKYKSFTSNSGSANLKTCLSIQNFKDIYQNSPRVPYEPLDKGSPEIIEDAGV